MDAETKLETVATQMDLEPAEEQGSTTYPCGVSATPKPSRSQRENLGIVDAVAGNKRVPMLKTLLTSACERNCNYCPFRAGRSYRRTTFSPDEMATTFTQLHDAGLVDGLFLSSGIVGGGVRTQDNIIATAELLRETHHFRGYMHLKIMPGAERDQVERTMQLADRVSVNLEGPNGHRLEQLAPRKVFYDELVRPLQWVEEIRRTQPAHRAWNGRWPSSVTQFVVGGVGESDLELLSAAEHLYRHAGLTRTYFSAFRPIVDTPFENKAAENPLREHRLYQASFLLRDYGFDLEDLPFTDDAGNLPLTTDPKHAWAEIHLRDAPIDLNRASREELLRVPAIGPKSADKILRERRRGTLRTITDLKKLGVQTARAVPYILLDGHRPAKQLKLW